MVSKNGLAVVAYFFGIIGAIIMYLITDRKDGYVRFHAVQSFLFNVCAGIIALLLSLVSMGMGFITGGPLVGLYSFVVFIVWIVLMVKAWQGVTYKLPVIGEWAAKYSSS